MMNPDYKRIIGASEESRRELFLASSLRLGTPIQNVEKDFWVCWILDLLFNARDQSEPRLLFKGGTSLSKSYGLISRFSEDIDITVFREDLGQFSPIDEMEMLSGKKQRAMLDSIKKSCQQYIAGSLKTRLEKSVEEVLHQCDMANGAISVDLDPDDPDQQTLLISYPSVSSDLSAYNPPTVKIEGGAKSALDPHRMTMVVPYTADDAADLDLMVSNIVTIDPERTFWDKIIILHGQRSWFERRHELRRQGQRVSRHYYDVYRLLSSEAVQQAANNLDLAKECTRHALMFFNSGDLDLASAHPGTFKLMPHPEMESQLRRDYAAMSGMIFGDIPDWGVIMDAIRLFEASVNSHSPE